MGMDWRRSKNDMNTHTSIPTSFEEIRNGLDPSYSYMIFESNEKSEKSVVFLKIKAIFEQYEKGVFEQILYQEKTTGRLLLVIKLNPDLAVMIKQENLNINLPKNIAIYFYSNNRGGHNHIKERL